MNAVHIENSQGEVKPIGGPISFSPVNPNRVNVPHYNALVLTLCVNGFDVHRILMDPGNAADLLQLPAFTQMKLSSNMLNSAGRILSGFSGATTTTLGNVTLPVKAGPVTQRVLFSIVEDLGPYNAIMSWTWLYSMKAVPSTYHQMVSYLTSAGQVNLLSSQLVARQCYQPTCTNKEGRAIPSNLPRMIFHPHSNHNMPPKLGWKKRTRWLWIHWKKWSLTSQRNIHTSAPCYPMKK